MKIGGRSCNITSGAFGDTLEYIYRVSPLWEQKICVNLLKYTFVKLLRQKIVKLLRCTVVRLLVCIFEKLMRSKFEKLLRCTVVKLLLF